MLNKPPPPVPNVSNANSKEDLRGHLMRQEEIEEQHRQAKLNRGSSKTSGKIPNGKQRTPHVPIDDASFDLGEEDSITKPLEPEPRYTAAVVASTSNSNHQTRNGGPGGAMMGNGRVPTNPPKSSGSRKKSTSNKNHSKPEVVNDEPVPDRPRTRPGSQAKEFASHLQLISDDDDF